MMAVCIMSYNRGSEVTQRCAGCGVREMGKIWGDL